MTTTTTTTLQSSLTSSLTSSLCRRVLFPLLLTALLQLQFAIERRCCIHIKIEYNTYTTYTYSSPTNTINIHIHTNPTTITLTAKKDQNTNTPLTQHLTNTGTVQDFERLIQVFVELSGIQGMKYNFGYECSEVSVIYNNILFHQFWYLPQKI